MSRVVLLFPRKTFPHPVSRAERVKASLLEVFDTVKEFERDHARLAWGVTLAGFAIGIALQSL